ncbi:beta-1,4-glucuronyltransferase 1-like [Culex pipiens pallens]|uniref:beta-1,4-glucuronyltransferase 1-like n=1 Tax=Culex pipiens pallens TaxID=42434 RepID=UPI00195493DA|nr:beta-1,4-glucuronyltransferase 1-like [Culex pipiens pallens]
MAITSKVPYNRLDQLNQLPPKPIILRIVLPLIVAFFVLFCLFGYFSPTTSVVYVHQHNEYLVQYLNDSDLRQELRSLLDCKSVDSGYRIETWGNFWVLRNFIAPRRPRPVECYETITYTTHGDYRFLENVIPLLERWQGPLSVAVYAPGEEFDRTIRALRELLYCSRQSYLVEEFASVHLYFDFDRMPPKAIKHYQNLIQQKLACPNTTNSFLTENATEPTPQNNAAHSSSSSRSSNHTYPVNVGRNIARDAAQTHFVLASDIELYPNPGFIDMFLRMVAHPVYRSTLDRPGVYVLPIFEVTDVSPVPEDKVELLGMLRRGEAIKFHEKICSSCHTVPSYRDWLRVVKVDQTMDILVTAKREGEFGRWEPIYVGTRKDPQYEERLCWEGKFDKMTQGYLMCVLEYDFHILDNGFLVHRPGIKTVSEAARPELELKQRNFVENVIFPELIGLYGQKEKCQM